MKNPQFAQRPASLWSSLIPVVAAPELTPTLSVVAKEVYVGRCHPGLLGVRLESFGNLPSDSLGSESRSVFSPTNYPSFKAQAYMTHTDAFWTK